MRIRHRMGPALVAMALVAVVSASFAQTSGTKTKPHRRPKAAPAASAPAQPANPDTPGDAPEHGVTSNGVAAADGGAAPLAPPAAPAVSFFDGGVRASPLNPNPEEFPGASQAPAATIDYDKLLSDVVALRARVAAVGDTLFQSRLAIAVRTGGDEGRVDRLVVSVDDGPVFSSASGFRSDDGTSVYEHAVAPGKHAVTVDVERRDPRDDAYGAAQRSRFVVDVPRDQQVDVEVRVEDSSTLGADFPKEHSGHYDLRLRAKVSAHPAKR